MRGGGQQIIESASGREASKACTAVCSRLAAAVAAAAGEEIENRLAEKPKRRTAR